jgi:8-oxo-dGTP diphosphatase
MEEVEPFFKSAFSVDNVIFGFDGGDLKVLLIQRNKAPYAHKWALPGDMVYPYEDINQAAVRVLEQLAGLRGLYLEQVGAFGAVNRHPLGRVITIAYFALVNIAEYTVCAQPGIEAAQWHKVADATDLAFDHHDILHASLQQLREKVRMAPVGFELLPPKFTLSALQHLYEAILEISFEKRNFRKKILSLNLLRDLDELQEGVAHRPARLYQFDDMRYRQFMAEGFHLRFETVLVAPNKRKEHKSEGN